MKADTLLAQTRFMSWCLKTYPFSNRSKNICPDKFTHHLGTVYKSTWQICKGLIDTDAKKNFLALASVHLDFSFGYQKGLQNVTKPIIDVIIVRLV